MKKLLSFILTACVACSSLAAKEPQSASCAAPPPKKIPTIASFCGIGKYYWNGTACVLDGAETGCKCDVLQCEPYETQNACEVAHATCR